MIGGSRRMETSCLVDIAHTPASLHAHAIPRGVAIRPGDTVLIHGAPTALPRGAVLRRECRVSVLRAGWLRRAWTRIAALGALPGLWETGFERPDCSLLVRRPQ